MKTKILSIIVAVGLLAPSAFGYGPRGHRMVGAIADRRLKKNKPVANKVKDLLDGLTLESAATLPDEIKSWDNCRRGATGGPVNASQRISRASKRINDELIAFVKANPCNGVPSHHDFHFTDVPVAGDEEYADGTVGRSKFDVVQMIPFSIRVLRGEEPETNPRGITKSVAVILLAHYLGDIHQPLHVGAEYFDASGKPFEPTASNKGFADQGGNKLTLFTLVKGKLVSAGKFHGYWDGQTVNNAFGSTPDSTSANKLGTTEPSNWKLAGEVETWAEQMANEIMPLAREAHDRLRFNKIQIDTGKTDIIGGRAEEKKKSGGKLYKTWAAATVKDEIHKGGWRLAALLEEILQ